MEGIITPRIITNVIMEISATIMDAEWYWYFT
jgi:hypothetical protein